MFCNKCGKELDDTCTFCFQCGATVKQKDESQQQVVVPAAVSPAKHAHFSSKPSMETKKNVVLLGIAILLISVVCVLSWWVNSVQICDHCNKEFRGSGYYDMLNSSTTMCEECAKQYYSFVGYKQFKK